MIGYVLLFTYLAHQRYKCFGSDSGDIAFYNNMMWWTIHGKPLFLGATTWNQNYLGLHPALIWFLVVPFYYVVPTVETIFLLQTAAIGLSAIPIFLLVRDCFQDEISALLAAVAFLFFPPIVSQNINQIHDLSFAPVFLWFALYLMRVDRFWSFLVACCFACLCRENIPFAVMMFGVIALLTRKKLRWVVSPVVLGLIWAALLFLVIMPHCGARPKWHVVGYFSYLGNTPKEMLINAVTSPKLILGHVFSSINILYFIQLVQPLVWFLPFCSVAVIPALPDLAGNLLSDNTALKVISWHYNLVTGTFLFAGTLFALKRVSDVLHQRFGGGKPMPALAACLLLFSIAHWFLWFQPAEYMERPYQQSLERAIAAIPQDAPVISSTRTIAHLSKRPVYEAINLFKSIREIPEKISLFDYVLLDANERQYPPFITQEFFDAFYKSPKCQLIFAESGVFVFRRVGNESDRRLSQP